MLNNHDSRLCFKCGKPLVLQVAIEMEEKEKTDAETLRSQIKDIIFDELKKIQKRRKTTDCVSLCRIFHGNSKGMVPSTTILCTNGKNIQSITVLYVSQ